MCADALVLDMHLADETVLRAIQVRDQRRDAIRTELKNWRDVARLVAQGDLADRRVFAYPLPDLPTRRRLALAA